jgi:hypothetical protein
MDLAQSTNVIPQKMITPDFSGLANSLKGGMDLVKGRVELEKTTQSLLANKAVSQAIKQNTNESGDLDIPSIISQLSKDENASINLPELATKLLQLKGQQFTTDTAKLTNLATKNTLAGQRLGPLVAQINDNKNISRDQLINEFAHMARIGVFSPQEAMQHMGMLPPKSNDPEQEKLNIHNFIKNEHLATINNEQLLGKLLPQQQYVATGGGTQILNTNQLTGGVTPNAFIQNQMPLGTPLIAQEGNNLGLPAGTQYLLNQGGVPTIIPQNTKSQGQGQVTSAAPMVSAFAPQTSTNIATSTDLVSKAREAAKTVASGRFNSNQIIRLADETNLGTASNILREVGGGFATVPWTSDSATNFDKLGHILAQQTQTIAQSPGINGTNAGQKLASDVGGTTTWTKQAIKDTSRINRSMFEATELFASGIKKAYDPKNPQKVLDFQDKWNKVLDINTLRLLDAYKNKTEDPSGFKEVVKELGGNKSERFITAAKHLDTINDLISKGE